MTPQPDQEVIAAAREIMEKRYVPGKHCIGAAIRTKSGKLFVGASPSAGRPSPSVSPQQTVTLISRRSSL